MRWFRFRPRRPQSEWDEVLGLPRGNLPLILKSALVGVLAGGVISLYRYVVGWMEEFCLLGYAFLRAHLAFIPVALGLLVGVGLLVGWLARRHTLIGGSGIPQVKGIIGGHIRSEGWFGTLWAKFVGGALSIGAGLSLGREGPSIQLGACLGEGVGQRFARTAAERKILIAGGASAGLAAAFNAPLAGVIFAFEEIFRYLSGPTLLATSVAAIAGDYVAMLLFGSAPVFAFHLPQAFPSSAYWLLLLLGGAAGLAGAGYNKLLIALHRAWNAHFARAKAAKPVPMFVLALAVGLFFPLALCAGAEIIELDFLGTAAGFLLLTLGIKLLFSVASFSSGAPGGIFYPLLVLGALVGALFGQGAVRWAGVGEGYYDHFIALAMAGMFAAIVRAPITGVVLITEMTGSFSNLLPLALVSVVAYSVADVLTPPVYDSLLDNLLKRREDEAALVSGERVTVDQIVHIGAPAEGKAVSELGLPGHCLLLSIARERDKLMPHGGTIVRAQDKLTFLCDKEREGALREFLKGCFEGRG
ncbi:MAG: ClC family H(+)/Cl(-) exchange transporter [Oscillospiraceae bacterium]|jgi:H+/Cl- antiporter ClcA|nr:ClC family H(+)/Cl(-) exchange transporter [Oscillospiraceae bacterium]